MIRKYIKYILPVLAVVMFTFAVVHVARTQQTKPQANPPVEPPRSPFGTNVSGAGIVEAQSENISIGSSLPGVVTRVRVKVNYQVRGPLQPFQVAWIAWGPIVLVPADGPRLGDPLFELDDRQLRAELRYRQANLDNARSQLAKLEQMPRPEEKPSSKAKVLEAEANAAAQQNLLERARGLYARQAMSEEDVVTREQAHRVAKAQLDRAKADDNLLLAGAWDADKFVAQSAVEQAEAQLQQTQTDLDRLIVRALVDGQVLQVNVRPGEFVGAPPSQALIVLGSIKQLHVRVDIDEHDIPRFRENLPAEASLRGDPSQKFPLRFVRVEPYVIPKKSLTGDNTERVDTRVLQVIYAIDNGKTPLYVGQQMDVSINTEGVATIARQ
ncbi:MAG TPA: HlyD family efflux transporter periplasmic adaptor subunit [Gemmataceae bacterium]